ncbi:MAG TPA: hypothetical protein VFX59_29160 [Polyangiales bacterium]|nr:hypothetical protein [Polyangiales bacterium]
MRVVERLPWYLGGAFAISLGLVAVAHTPLGQPVLAWLSPACPVDFGRPEELERARVQAIAGRRGAQAERTRPAHEFELGQSTRAHVEAALTRQGGRCEPERADTALRCSLPDAQLFAQFADGKLVALDSLRSAADPSRALAWLIGLEHTLSARVGEATARFGSFEAAALGARFAQSIVEYRYANYVAQISALNTGDGIKLREQYQTF